MQKILLVKITSMGDLIQMLPAITDAARAIPGIQFDWVAEESFVAIPQLHPAINKIITLPYRRWKKEGIQWKEVKTFLKTLRSQKYDMVIDSQSNLKSAFVTSLARGKKFGLDKKSVREYGAQFFYHKKIAINRAQNHAARMRQLMAAFLNYDLTDIAPDYGIDLARLPSLDINLPDNFILVTHICSASMRLWPEPYWVEVLSDLVNKDYEIMLPWWSQEEKDRVDRLKAISPKIHAIPPLNLTEKATLLTKARAAISLDTGLSHMAAALNIPNLSLYGPTNSKFTGAYGKNQVHLDASGPECAPCVRMHCSYKGESQFKPACMETIKPKQVLDAFYRLLDKI